eukprot:m.163317 g.163317  ORF g.163317 m.163317 type:complete len:737 (-) comp17110_c2_seq1:638-2848(-)
MAEHAFTEADALEWDSDGVAVWLGLVGLRNLIEKFHDNDINGKALLKLDEEALQDMDIDAKTQAQLHEAVERLRRTERSGATDHMANSDSDSDGESPPSPEKTASSAAVKRSSNVKSSAPVVIKDKKSDPLRIAAAGKSAVELSASAVHTGFMYKLGGSGLKPKKWQKRYFVLTDDNCLYYFKSPKDLNGLGMVLLPSYTITLCDKSENVGSKPYAFKAFNREHEGMRKYIFAAENDKDMKTWMNVMSLASIAFGTGKAAMSKTWKEAPKLSDEKDPELLLMQKRGAERAGGVTAASASTGPATAPAPTVARPSVPPAAVAAAAARPTSKPGGPVLCLVKLLDGQTLQLYAEAHTTAQQFLDQICTMLKAFEKYYFGLKYVDNKGDQDWMKLDKKVLKHEFKSTTPIEIEFCIRFFPVDVTQVLQYVTLYQCFLAAKTSVMRDELDVSNKDAFLLGSLALQALKGDYDPAVHTPASLSSEPLIPARNKKDIAIESNIRPGDLNVFWAEEIIRVWKTLQGILRHLAVLKYMQIIQKHKRFAMQYFNIKNKNGTPLVLGVSPNGVFVFRDRNTLQKPSVTFSWAECSELGFTEKKFTIQVHDKETKAFSVYCARSKICQTILHLCIGLHRLYVQAVRQWSDPPAELDAMRREAIQAALVEREELKKEALAVRKKAKERRAELEAKAASQKKAAPASAPAPAAAPAPAPAAAAAAFAAAALVVVAGGVEAVGQCLHHRH